MIVADTHSLLWWMADDSQLSASARRRFDNEDTVVVPAMVCWEIALLVSRGRISLGADTVLYLDRALNRPRVHLEPLSPRIAVRANSFGDTLHRDPADRLIVATAMELGAPIVTRDERIRAFTSVETIW